MTRPAKPRPSLPGIIEPPALYTLQELQARSGLGAWGMRQARRAGLQVLRVHGRTFIEGQAFIEYVRRIGNQGG
jgi:hypothetical protein